jgi:hypothetical protein
VERLLVEALRAGVPVSEFWDMTPCETVLAIEAAAWRLEQDERGRLRLAWHVAALSRAKRLPPLAQLMAPQKQSRTLSGEELEARRREFAEMRSVWERTIHDD